MHPVAFLRKAWKKWEQKRKRNVSASTFNYVPSPRRSRSWSHRRPGGNTFRRSALPNPDKILFEDYTKSALTSHKLIKRRKSASTVKGRTSGRVEQVVTTSSCHDLRRESLPGSPLSCFTLPPRSKYPSLGEEDDHASDFHPRLERNSCPSACPKLPSLHLPAMGMKYTKDDVYRLSGFKSDRSSLSSHSSPNIPCLNIVEKSRAQADPRVTFRGQTARITSRQTRMVAPPAEPPENSRHPTDRFHPKTKMSTSPKVYYDSHTSVSPPEISIPRQSGDVHDSDFPLSLFPQPPPLLVRKKVPKPLVFQPARHSSPSSHSLLPYSPLGIPKSPRPRSSRSLSQASFSSSTKRAFGRPLASISPPPTSPPSSPLPSPPVDKWVDSKFLSSSSLGASTRQVYRGSAEYN